MSHTDLEKRVAHLEAMVAQLYAFHELNSSDIVSLENAVGDIDEHLDLGVDVTSRMAENKVDVIEAFGFDLAALDMAVVESL